MRIANFTSLLLASMICFSSSSHAVIITEDFESYPIQSDFVGIIDDGETLYEVNNNSGVRAGGFTEGVSSGTEIFDESSRVWILVTSGVTQNSGGTFDGHIGLAELWSGSSIGNYLAPGRDLSNSSFSVDMVSFDSTNSYFRFLLEDSDGTEAWSQDFTLTQNMDTFMVNVLDINTLLPGTGGDGVFDITDVTEFGFDLFDLPGTTVNGWEYDVDNIVLNTSAVPVPAALWLFGSGLMGLIGIARRKKA